MQHILALTAAALALGVVTGYVRMTWSNDDLVRYFARAQVLMVGAYGGRAIFWSSLLPYVVGRDRSGELNFLYGTWLNMAFDALFAIGCYYALLTLLLMIPEEDRWRYRWYMAPHYPPWSVTDLVRWLFGWTRRRK